MLGHKGVYTTFDDRDSFAPLWESLVIQWCIEQEGEAVVM